MVELRAVTKENLRAVTELQIEDDQMGFVEDNLWSMAECYVEPAFVPKAIYDDEKLIGFVLYYFVKGDPEKDDDPDYVFLHRIMIDKREQGHGYGVRSLDACVEQFKKEFPSIGCVELIHYPDNDRGAHVYEKSGFLLTGSSYESAPGRIETGSDNPNRTYEVVRRRYYRDSGLSSGYDKDR